MKKFYTWIKTGINDDEIRPILLGFGVGILVFAMFNRNYCSRNIVIGGKWNRVG